MASNDPDFETKAADIIGLYLESARACGRILRRREDRDSGFGSARSRVAALTRTN